MVDPKQGYKNTKFEKLHLNSDHEKANNKVFVKSGNINYFPLYVGKVKNSGIFLTCFKYLTILQSFNLIGEEHKMFS